jgi:NADH-quinone oxidoreductase subunit J
MAELYFFYFFSFLAITASAFVIFASNAVHSVLWLILVFLSVAGLFILLGAEFLALILMIVYVGALAVLFLFVVMMINLSFANLRKGVAQYLPFGLLIGVVIFAELCLALLPWSFKEDASLNRLAPINSVDTNTEALGKLIYTDYFLIFQASGIILLVAMIGSIVLTLRKRPYVKRQNILSQIYRDQEEAIEVKDVKPYEGI